MLYLHSTKHTLLKYFTERKNIYNTDILNVCIPYIIYVFNISAKQYWLHYNNRNLNYYTYITSIEIFDITNIIKY